MSAPTSTSLARGTGSISDDGSIFAFDGADALLRAWGGGLKPDPLLTVSEWADRYRMLSSRAAAEPGRYRTKRTPYMKDIMDALSPGHPAQRIVFMKAAQVGATEAGNCFLGFIIHQAPGPALAVQPTVELAKRNSRQRIDPLIEESPALRDKVKPARSRDAGNTMLSKEFAGGILIMTGANSAVGLRSTPARYIFLDEVDAYPASADEEGDPVSLAEARSLTFAHRRKVFLASTPTIRGLSRIEREYEASDQRRYFVACPHCGHRQWLKFERLRWEKGKPETAAYACEGCDAAIAEHHKTAMLEAGEWRPTATSADPSTIGFHLSALYSPVGVAELGADRPGVGGGAGLGRGDPGLPQHHPRRDLGRDRRGAGLEAALRPAGAAGASGTVPKRRPVPDRRGRRAEGPHRGRRLGLGPRPGELARRSRRHRRRAGARRRAGTRSPRCSVGPGRTHAGHSCRSPGSRSTPATRRRRSMPGRVGRGSRRSRRSRASRASTGRARCRGRPTWTRRTAESASVAGPGSGPWRSRPSRPRPTASSGSIGRRRGARRRWSLPAR